MKSKSGNETPPELCSGVIQAIWEKNQPPSFRKTPGTLQKTKPGILLIFGQGRSLEEKGIDEYNDSYSTVFNSYDIYTTPDICQTP